MALPRTLAELQELALLDIEQRAPDLAARRAGTLPNTIAGVGALLGTDAMRFCLREVAKTFVATAEGGDLDALARDHFDLGRHPASAAGGSLRLVRTSDVIATVPAGAQFLDASGAVYFALEDTAVSGPTGIVPVQAQRTGSATNRQRGSRFSAASAAWTVSWPGLSISAAEDLAGGNDAELDQQFRDRIAVWWQSLRRGTGTALRHAALSVSGVRRATVSEEHIRPHRGGWVDLFVLDGSDGFSSVLGSQVRAAVDSEGRAAGVVVNVAGGEVVYQPIRIKMTARVGVSSGAVAAAAAAVRDYVNGLPIGGGVSRSRLAAAALSGDGNLLNAQVVVPATDVVAEAHQVVRCRAEEVTIL